ncbi:EamA-like transporter family protein [Neobacillus piezotolerans]|uniref:EamA-like transporter family protein n=1 Tax=Neobacillus piezotolerans TaxID=2259171 RepID=A0A3D8GMI4_9BACI|nr:DMT family transporter [Neobacillus piezotolerans]RDU35694.1 EamA-like transporter family protein [Neobacillus piezotolerans]
MITGLVLAAVSGALLSVQNVFNSKVSLRAGTKATTALVLFLGFLASFLIGLGVEGKSMFALQNMQTWYWFSGMLGVGVVVSVVQAVMRLGPTYGISIVMVSQLVYALIMDSLGLMGLEKMAISGKHLVGVLVIVAGILVFKFGGVRKADKA